MARHILDLTTRVKRHVIDMDHLPDEDQSLKRQKTSAPQWNITWLQAFTPSPDLVGMYINQMEACQYGIFVIV